MSFLLLGAGGFGGGADPALDFSDADNSQFLYLLLEEWLF